MNGQTQVSVNPPHTPFPLKKQKNKVHKRITDCYFLTGSQFLHPLSMKHLFILLLFVEK